jgi:hypothetical protein
MGTKNSAPRFTIFDWSLLPLHDVMTNSFLDALKYDCVLAQRNEICEIGIYSIIELTTQCYVTTTTR